MMAETGIEFPLVEADAGATGLPDASFDLVVSEYGASIWVDPYRWIPEAARLLRPAAGSCSSRNSTLVILCSDDDGRCVERARQRPQFGHAPLRVAGRDGVEFHLPHGEWIDLLRANGFEIERLIEIQAPADAETHQLLLLRHRRVGEAVALRGDLGRAQDDRLIVLASTSPQRRAILEQLRHPVRRRRARLRRGARRTSRSSTRPARHARSTAASTPVLGVDTEVLLDGELLGKPANAADAERMLERLSGRTHEVVLGSLPAHAGVGGAARRDDARHLPRLTPRDLAHYLAAGEWEGRAGAYAIQGLGASLVERIEGDYLNVVGLPGALLVVCSRALPGRLRVRLMPRVHDDELDIDEPTRASAAARAVPRVGRASARARRRRHGRTSIYRLGDELSVRLPRRECEQAEHRPSACSRAWRRTLAVARSRASSHAARRAAAIPWHWSVVDVARGRARRRGRLPADDVGRRSSRSLQAVDAQDAPEPAGGRGKPLAARDRWVRGRARARRRTGRRRALARGGARAGVGPDRRVWIHCDLDRRNVLAAGRTPRRRCSTGASAGAGDPAVDVHGGLEAGRRATSATGSASSCQIDDATWLRAQGWCVSQALIALGYYTPESNPPIHAEATRWLAEVLARLEWPRLDGHLQLPHGLRRPRHGGRPRHREHARLRPRARDRALASRRWSRSTSAPATCTRSASRRSACSAARPGRSARSGRSRTA